MRLPDALRTRVSTAARWLQKMLLKPTFVALLYLFAIPVFAGAYALHWREFYQSTSTSDFARVAMEYQLRTLLREAPSDWRKTLQCRDAAKASLSRLAVEPSDNLSEPAQIVQYLLIGERGRWGQSTEYRLIWHFMFDREYIRGLNFGLPGGTSRQGGPPTLDRTVMVQISGIPSEFANNCNYALTSDPVTAFERNTRHSWVLTSSFAGNLFIERPSANASYVGFWHDGRDLAPRIRDYYIICRGTPAPAAFGFGRYLYLSVVTITTLGFGDMVPITDRARALVAIEAVFGVVVAGLFLNALATRISDRRRDGR